MPYLSPVAPLAGARIEMEADGRPALGGGVAPSAGVWIEMVDH